MSGKEQRTKCLWQLPRSGLLLFLCSQIIILTLIYLSLQSWYTENRKSVYKYERHFMSNTNQLTLDDREYALVQKMKVEEVHRKKISWDNVMTEAIDEHDQVLESTNKNNGSKCKSLCESQTNDISQTAKHWPFFDKNFRTDTRFLSEVLKEKPSPQSLCDGNLHVQYSSFAMLKEATIIPFRWNVTAKLVPAGKELYTFKDEFVRTDDAEYVKPKKGLLDMYCPHVGGTINNKTKDNIFLLKYLWIRTLTSTYDKNVALPGFKSAGFDFESRFTVAILRNDYANLYNVMLQAYNIFMMLMVYHQQPQNMTLLILDSHPKAETDPVLQTLYGPFVRMGNLRRPLKFQTLLLSLAEGNSLLSNYRYQPPIPYLKEFRKFVYSQHNLDDTTSLDCTNLKITIIWRRNKVYHPRNLKGSVHRKIFNEVELYNALREEFPNTCVQGFLPDTMPFGEQLKVIRETDILIGMHGAGLIHSLFLPPTSGLIEMFPFEWPAKHPYHPLFQAVTRWRRLHYMIWENSDKMMEKSHFFTTVDVTAILELTDQMIYKICYNHYKKSNFPIF